eukprot:CAMPEP_0194286306 /NCGR_PEP_ID=MMETSP0169-20130528/32260_1 /TAXON_ID=218684 /ORGANISM="Corethron pennatum, Strain L29A3" /LENGTH=1057 /DNA_ID=CAMNT_0039032707 /DNA_START=97 /DNA_END=3267 /DNA_ORIENTATION=-
MAFKYVAYDDDSSSSAQSQEDSDEKVKSILQAVIDAEAIASEKIVLDLMKKLDKAEQEKLDLANSKNEVVKNFGTDLEFTEEIEVVIENLMYNFHSLIDEVWYRCSPPNLSEIQEIVHDNMNNGACVNPLVRENSFAYSTNSKNFDQDSNDEVETGFQAKKTVEELKKTVADLEEKLSLRLMISQLEEKLSHAVDNEKARKDTLIETKLEETDNEDESLHKFITDVKEEKEEPIGKLSKLAELVLAIAKDEKSEEIIESEPPIGPVVTSQTPQSAFLANKFSKFSSTAQMGKGSEVREKISNNMPAEKALALLEEYAKNLQVISSEEDAGRGNKKSSAAQFFVKSNKVRSGPPVSKIFEPGLESKNLRENLLFSSVGRSFTKENGPTPLQRVSKSFSSISKIKSGRSTVKETGSPINSIPKSLQSVSKVIRSLIPKKNLTPNESEKEEAKVIALHNSFVGDDTDLIECPNMSLEEVMENIEVSSEEEDKEMTRPPSAVHISPKTNRKQNSSPSSRSKARSTTSFSSRTRSNYAISPIDRSIDIIMESEKERSEDETSAKTEAYNKKLENEDGNLEPVSEEDSENSSRNLSLPSQSRSRTQLLEKKSPIEEEIVSYSSRSRSIPGSVLDSYKSSEDTSVNYEGRDTDEFKIDNSNVVEKDQKPSYVKIRFISKKSKTKESVSKTSDSFSTGSIRNNKDPQHNGMLVESQSKNETGSGAKPLKNRFKAMSFPSFAKLSNDTADEPVDDQKHIINDQKHLIKHGTGQPTYSTAVNEILETKDQMHQLKNRQPVENDYRSRSRKSELDSKLSQYESNLQSTSVENIHRFSHSFSPMSGHSLPTSTEGEIRAVKSMSRSNSAFQESNDTAFKGINPNLRSAFLKLSPASSQQYTGAILNSTHNNEGCISGTLERNTRDVLEGAKPKVVSKKDKKPKSTYVAHTEKVDIETFKSKASNDRRFYDRNVFEGQQNNEHESIMRKIKDCSNSTVLEIRKSIDKIGEFNDKDEEREGKETVHITTKFMKDRGRQNKELGQDKSRFPNQRRNFTRNKSPKKGNVSVKR